MKTIFALLLLFHACQDDASKPKKCSPTWIEQTKNSIIQNGQKGEITKYLYKNQFVFLVKDCLNNCADNMDVVRDCEGKTICEFGGIAGMNTCPDFNKAVKIETVWKN